MGQYYTPVLKDTNGKYSLVNTWDYDCGSKLMEHSYCGNPVISAVLSLLLNNPQQVWWFGDYTEIKDFNTNFTPHKLYAKERKKIFNCKHPNFVYEHHDWDFDNALLINLDKREYINIKPYEDGKFTICPLSILTAVGNGKGGGDYRGENMEFVGAWSGDTLMVAYDKESATKSITDFRTYHWVTPLLTFERN